MVRVSEFPGMGFGLQGFCVRVRGFRFQDSSFRVLGFAG